jgi:hypothetical protein
MKKIEDVKKRRLTVSSSRGSFGGYDSDSAKMELPNQNNDSDSEYASQFNSNQNLRFSNLKARSNINLPKVADNQ